MKNCSGGAKQVNTAKWLYDKLLNQTTVAALESVRATARLRESCIVASGSPTADRKDLIKVSLLGRGVGRLGIWCERIQSSRYFSQVRSRYDLHVILM